jgi:hypothetical protein
VCGHAVNPITNEAWFDLLGKTLQGEMDEIMNLIKRYPFLKRIQIVLISLGSGELVVCARKMFSINSKIEVVKTPLSL